MAGRRAAAKSDEMVESITLSDGKSRVWIRADKKSANWQFYTYFKKDIPRTTGTPDRAKAIVIGERLLAEIHGRVAAGKEASPTAFETIAEAWLVAEEKRRKRRQAASTFDDPMDHLEPGYIKEIQRRVRVYLIPYFGAKTPIDAISDAKVRGYKEWRQGKRDDMYAAKLEEKEGAGTLSANLSSTAFNTEMSYLRAIFKHAVDTDAMIARNTPKIQNMRSTSKPRLGHTPGEYDLVMTVVDDRWRESVISARERWRSRERDNDFWVADREAWSRFVILAVAEIISHTGMRPSSLLRVRKCDVRQVQATGGDPEFMLLSRTKKGREDRETWIVAHHKCAYYIEFLLDHCPTDTSYLIDITSHALSRAWHKVLVAAGLEFDNDGRRHGLYDLRSYYITWQLLRGVDVALLAANTQTSMVMIDRHYNKMKPLMKKGELLGYADIIRKG